MYMNVQSICTKNNTAWTTIPAFKKSYDNFVAGVKQLNELNTQLQNKSIPTTISKKATKQTMADRTMVLIGAAKAYASVVKDTALAARINYTHSQIMATKDVDADDMCMAVVEVVRGILPNLSEYAVSQTEFDATIGAIHNFSQLIGAPKSDIMTVKSLNEQMVAVFKNTDTILDEQLDNLMVNFKFTNETFFKEYTSARKIKAAAAAKKEEPAKNTPAEGK